MGLTPDLVQRARARVGTSLSGKWRLERLLGIGGMAAVYAAQHRNQKRVAIKILHAEMSVEEGIKTRFLREGYVANSVDHPGAVAVFDDDVSEDGAAFLVMELLSGETLEDRAERHDGKLPLNEVLPLTDQLLDVLASAHERGIIHRDIKPENLFLTTAGEVKVLDFGIARLRELSMSPDGSTGVGSFMGTPAFMSPEQARGRWNEVDFRSDVWAVGATMFTLLTGRSVHEGESLAEQLVLAATAAAPSLAIRAPDLPPAVVELVDKALAFDKGERWPGVKTMQEALKHVIVQLGPSVVVSAPRTSISLVGVDRDSPTIAAPPGALPEAGPSHSSSLSSAITSSSYAPPPTVSRRGRRGAIAAVAVAAVLLVIFALRGRDDGSSTGGAAASVSGEPAPAPRARNDEAPAAHTEPAVSAPAVVTESAASSSASSAPSSGVSKRAKPPGRARPVAPPARSAAPPPAASPASPPRTTSDPLERRY